MPRRHAGAAVKIREALDLLKEASGEKKEEVFQRLHDIYEDISDSESRIVEKVKDNPWLYVGAAAFGGLLTGLLLRLTRRHGR